jgi:hypothetical protein
MKTTFYIVAIVAFSALMLNPKQPPEYPPMLEQRKRNCFMSKKINSIIKKNRIHPAIDSVQIHMQNEQ